MRVRAGILTTLFATAMFSVSSAAAAGHAHSGTIDLEELLTRLARSVGMSFVVDSSLLSGRTIAAIEIQSLDDPALASALREYDLQIEKLNERTFTVLLDRPTTAPLLDVRPPMRELVPPDVIIVMAHRLNDGAVSGVGRASIISSSDIEMLDVTTAGEVIHDLPQSVSSFTPGNTVLRGALGGVSFGDLRGLGPERTLVLVDGRRRPLTPGGTTIRSGIDLNAIAMPFVERVEVVNGSAGARYGDGAVAGAVNFVTREADESVKGGFRTAISQRGDAIEKSAHAFGAFTLGDIQGSTGVAFLKNDGLRGGDRTATAMPFGFAVNNQACACPGAVYEPGFGGSTVIPAGSIVGAVLSDGTVKPFPTAPFRYIASGTDALSPQTGELQYLFNWATYQDALAPVDQNAAFLKARIDFSSSASAFVEASVTFTTSDINLAPVPAGLSQGGDRLLGDSIAIGLSNPAVPPTIRALFASQFDGEAQSLILERRFNELGPRRQKIDRHYFNFVGGVKYSTGAGDGEIAYRFGRAAVRDSLINLVDRTRLEVALDPVQCATSPGCEAASLFSGAPLSAQTANFIRADPVKRRLEIDEHELQASYNISLNAARDARVNFSAFLRRTSFADQRLGVVSPVIGAFSPSNPHGSVAETGVRSSFAAELINPDTLIGAVRMSLGAEFTTDNRRHHVDPKVDGEVSWALAPGLEVFARGEVGRRPPNIIELFDTTQAMGRVFVDPCDAAKGLRVGEVAINCAAGGPLSTPDDFVQTSHLTTMTGYGNPSLRAERVRYAALGGKISTDANTRHGFLRAEFEGAYSRIDILDMIKGNEFAVAECFQSIGLSDSACGFNPRTGLPLIRRDPLTQQITSFDILLDNRGTQTWRGVDLSATLRAEIKNSHRLNSLWLRVDHAFVLRSVYEDNSIGLNQDLLGTIDIPRHVSFATAGAEFDAMTLALHTRRRGAVRTGPISIESATLPATTLFDVTAKFALGSGISLRFGVENLANSDPPTAPFTEYSGVSPQYYDIVGRRYSLGLYGSL